MDSHRSRQSPHYSVTYQDEAVPAFDRVQGLDLAVEVGARLKVPDVRNDLLQRPIPLL